MYRSSTQKINKENLDLNITLEKLDLTHITSKKSRIYILFKYVQNILQAVSYVTSK